MRYEITIAVGQDDKSSMVLLDRCTLEADNLKDAAEQYAEALISPASPRVPVVTWKDPEA